jgi:tetratricopeptide (TPR) repeat protein
VRRALEADPSSADAHLLLTTRMAESGRHEEALELCAAGLEHASASDVRARLASLRAQLLELRGDRRGAAEAWGIAAQADPTSGGAALSQARILRALGEWEAAAEALAGFVERHPDAGDPSLAPVQFQRGRLLAGPLERVDEALDAYRAAIAANPRFREAHAALAGLLVHRPESWDEALARLRDLLEAKPTDAAHLRGVLNIAQGRERASAVHLGRMVLSALGAATAEERGHESGGIEPTSSRPGDLENPVWECARRLAVAASEEIGRALSAPAESPPVGNLDDPLAAYRTAALTAEGELAAPALVPLEDAEVAEVLRIVAELACDAEQVHGDGHRVNRLSGELGRRARRRVRRELGSVAAAEIAEIDFAAWRCELRTLAHFQALAQSGGDLRTALLALLDGDAGCERPGPDADLAAALEGAPAALALLRRVVLSWIDGI